MFSVTYGELFADYLFSEEQIQDWQKYWRELAFVGILDRKITDYQIDKVETEQKQALERIESNRIK